MLGELGLVLVDSHECESVIRHPFFDRVRSKGLSKAGAQAFIGQFWHPSHTFPSFLAGLIARSPSLDVKTSLSRVLWQELGEGDPQRAHESIYVSSMVAAGFRDPSAPEDAPTTATAHLVALYESAATDFLTGLGCVYATEAIDLPIVTALGDAVTAATGVAEIPWVEIHALQEPDHIESARAAVGVELEPSEADRVAEAAMEMWRCWNEFYSAVDVLCGDR